MQAVLTHSVIRSNMQRFYQLRGKIVIRKSVRLLLINTATCGVLYSAGDFCRQKIDGKELNWSRTGRMGFLGCCLGPLDHFWYTALDKLLPAVTTATVFRKVMLDQIIMAPICCTLFFLGMSAMEGQNKEECVDELKTKFWPTYKMDWKIWPAAQMVNFFFIPPQFRVTYVAAVTFLWTVYLSYMKHKNIKMPSSSFDHELNSHLPFH